MKKTFCVLMLSVLVLGSQAMASLTESHSVPFSGSPTKSWTLSFPRFDTMGGTRNLLSVEIKFNLNVNNGTLLLDNDGQAAASGTFEFGAKGTISSSQVPLLNSVYQPVVSELGAFHTGTFNLAGNTGDGDDAQNCDPSAPDGMTYAGGLESRSSQGLINPMLISQYAGSGSYNINVEVLQWANFGGQGGIAYTVLPLTSNGNVEVNYSYEVVPEPATVGLLLLGGLGMIRRKK